MGGRGGRGGGGGNLLSLIISCNWPWVISHRGDICFNAASLLS